MLDLNITYQDAAEHFELPTPEFPHVWDSTLRSSFVLCPRKFYHAHILHLRPKEESVHLVAGAAFAKGLEVVRWAFYAEKLDVDAALCKGLVALIAEYGKFELPDEDKKSLISMCEALVGYFDNYHPGTDPAQPYMVNGKPCVEFNFALPIPDCFHPDTGLPLLYAGRFDMVSVFHDQLMGVDEKTASQLGATWADQWPLRAQFIGYAWGARHFELPLMGTLIRGVGLYASAPRVRFAQAITMVNEVRIERWLNQLKRDIHQAIACWKEGFWDYRLDTACTAYGGCVYKDICLVNDPNPWYSKYRVFKWDPLAINKVKDKPWRFA